MTASTLGDLVQAVHADEAEFGYATKEKLLAVAEYIITNYPWRDFSKAEYDEAIKLLAKYRLAPLADRLRGRRLIEKERAKAYEARCSNCGAVITSVKSKRTGLGIDCRRKLGVKGKLEQGGVVVGA